MELKLFNQDNIQLLKTLPDNSIDSIVTDPPYGISFMGKKWDYDVPSVETWKECLRVLKPGGHILVACGTRTQHRMAVNIEVAGFEIRDIVAWIYGSGFPKSLNIGKAVDKLQGNEREVVGKKPYTNDRGMKGNNFAGGKYERIQLNETVGNSPYEGWGTALKPAMELWTMARKPLSEKNVAENVLKWGTGGVNIDSSRVETKDNLNGGIYSQGEWVENPNEIFGARRKVPNGYNQPTGRFPANVIHDGSDEVTDLFPNTKSGKIEAHHKANNYQNSSYHLSYASERGYGDSGSASRFFYCAKASKSERNAGLDEFEEKNYEGRWNNSGEWVGMEKSLGKNHHPTVKPVALMRYLVKMITPTGGMVLDPFMGSGSTGVACMKENFNFTGIELDPEYFKIAEARIGNANE